MIHRKRYTTFMVAVCAWLVSLQGSAQESASSFISIPIDIDLQAIEQRVNAAIPEILEDSSELCYRKRVLGIRISVHCTTRVTRAGDATVTRNRDSIKLSIPIRAEVEGRHSRTGITQSVRATATFFIEFRPKIGPDWEVIAEEFELDYRWDESPNIKILNLVDISVSSRVDPVLRQRLDQLRSALPNHLTNLDLRSSVEGAWKEIQQPIAIQENPLTQLFFTPNSVGISSFSIADDALKTQVMLAGETRVVVGMEESINPIPLPSLQAIKREEKGEFRFDIPIFISFEELERTFNQGLGSEAPGEHHINVLDGDLKGDVVLSNLEVRQLGDAGISIAIDIDHDGRPGWLRTIDIYDWFKTSGRVALGAIPKINPKERTIFTKDLRIRIQADSPVVDTLARLANLPIIRDYLTRISQYSYGDAVDAAIAGANQHLNRELSEGARLHGKVHAAGIDNLRVRENGMSITVHASGELGLEVVLESPAAP